MPGPKAFWEIWHHKMQRYSGSWSLNIKESTNILANINLLRYAQNVRFTQVLDRYLEFCRKVKLLDYTSILKRKALQFQKPLSDMHEREKKARQYLSSCKFRKLFISCCSGMNDSLGSRSNLSVFHLHWTTHVSRRALRRKIGDKGLKGICPRGNNKVVIIIFHVYDKCLFLMLELY
jgi:hypothetical protein